MAVIRCGRRQFDLNLITVEPVLFLYMIGTYLTYPTVQAFVYKKVCTDRYNQTFCSSLRNRTFQEEHKTEGDYVQSQASYWILKMGVVALVPSCLTVLFLYGSWGDKVGRKLPVIIPCMGSTLCSIVYLLMSIYPSSKLEYVLIGAVVGGFSGGFPTLLMSVYSYISHIADPNSKTMRIGILESMTFFAGTLGVFMSGVMLDNTSYMFVFTFISCSFFLGLVYSIIRLENITANTRRHEGEGVCMFWCLMSIVESGRCVMKKREEKKNLYIFFALIIFIIIVIGTSCEIDVLLLYTRRPPLSWSQTTFGYFKGLENFTRSITLVTVLPLCRNMRDTTVGLWGLTSKIIGLVVLGLSTKTWLTFLVVIFAMFQGFPATVIRSLLSNMVSQGEQGRLFGLVAAMESIASLLASLLFNQLYPLSLGFFPGFCFLLAAGLFVIAVALMLWLHLDSRRLAGYKTIQEGQTDTDSPQSDRYVTAGDEEVKANNVTGGPDQI